MKNRFIYFLVALLLNLALSLKHSYSLSYRNSTFTGHIHQAIFLSPRLPKNPQEPTCLHCSFNLTDTAKRLSQLSPRFGQNAQLSFIEDKSLIILQESALKVFSFELHSERLLALASRFELKIEFPFSKGKAASFFYRATGINSGNYLIAFKGKFYNAYKENQAVGSKTFELVSSGKLPFSSHKIKRVFHNEHSLVVLLSSSCLFIATLIDKGELVVIRRIDEHYLFPEASESPSKEHRLKIVDVWPTSPCPKAVAKGLVQSCFRRSELLPTQSRICHKVSDFCVRLLLVEPLNSKDKSSLELCYGDLVKRKSMRKTKLALNLQPGLYQAFEFNGVLVKLIKSGTEYFLSANKRNFFLADNERPALLYANNLAGVFLMAFLVKDKIIFYQLFENARLENCAKPRILKASEFQVYSIVIDNISAEKIDQKQLNFVPFFRDSSLFAAIYYKDLLSLFRVDFGNFVAKCKPVKNKTSFFSCKEKLKVSYIKLDRFLNAKKNKADGLARSSVEFDLTFVFYKIELAKVLGLIAVLAGMALVFYFLKSKAEKRAINRYERIKKTN